MAQARSTKALYELTVFSQRKAIRRKRLILLKKTLDQVPFFIEQPVDWPVFAPGRIALDMRGCAQIICDELPQMISIIGGVHDDMLRVCQPFDQATRLWAVTPLAGCDDGPDRQAEGIHSGMYLGGQSAFGAANTGSFKPPF